MTMVTLAARQIVLILPVLFSRLLSPRPATKPRFYVGVRKRGRRNRAGFRLGRGTSGRLVISQPGRLSQVGEARRKRQSFHSAGENCAGSGHIEAGHGVLNVMRWHSR